MPQDPGKDWRRRIPSVDVLLRESDLFALVRLYGREFVRVQVRRHIEEWRRPRRPRREGPPGGGEAAGCPAGPPAGAPEAIPEAIPEGAAAWAEILARRIGAERQSLGEGATRRVLNATGVYLHTNLGRSPVARDVLEAAAPLLDAGSDLEMNLATGQRGDRGAQVQALLRQATGAEAALVVNNCAGALILSLAALAAGREVVVSRGELVEIGGSFRIPDLIAAAGVRLHEVGTTNRVRLDDYERAVGAETAGILRVSPSNFKVRGFTAAVEDAALADLARRRGLAWIADQGSGLLRPSSRPDLREHRSLAGFVVLGVDLACGSGDKLLGGPQAGLLVGRADAVAACRRHPWYRVLRPGRVTLALLEVVLRRRLAGELAAWEQRPGGDGALLARVERLRASAGVGEIRPAQGFLGGGSAPDEPLVAPAIAIALSAAAIEDLARRLRGGDPAVVGVVRDGALWIDLRAVEETDDAALALAIRRAVEGVRATPRAGYE